MRTATRGIRHPSSRSPIAQLPPGQPPVGDVVAEYIHTPIDTVRFSEEHTIFLAAGERNTPLELGRRGRAMDEVRKSPKNLAVIYVDIPPLLHSP